MRLELDTTKGQKICFNMDNVHCFYAVEPGVTRLCFIGGVYDDVKCSYDRLCKILEVVVEKKVYVG